MGTGAGGIGATGVGTGAGDAAVAGNTAVTAPEPAVFVAVASATVKKFAPTPANVKPAVGVRVVVAV